jgi:hypothetical protein
MTTLAAKALARIAALRKEQSVNDTHLLKDAELVDQDLPNSPELNLAKFNCTQIYELPLAEIQNQYLLRLQENTMKASN